TASPTDPGPRRSGVPGASPSSSSSPSPSLSQSDVGASESIPAAEAVVIAPPVVGARRSDTEGHSSFATADSPQPTSSSASITIDPAAVSGSVGCRRDDVVPTGGGSSNSGGTSSATADTGHAAAGSGTNGGSVGAGSPSVSGGTS